MFGWFKPTCPLDLSSKLWCEEAVLELVGRFGTEHLAIAATFEHVGEVLVDQ